MPAQMRRWFAHLATVEAEMRTEIDRLLEEHKTPLELAVRIRCHPKMRVTAPSKQKAAVRAAAAYGGALVESRYFLVAPEAQAVEWLNTNEQAVHALLRSASEQGKYESIDSGKSLWRGVSTDHVVEFVERYNFHAMNTDAPNGLITAYIKKRHNRGGLYSWNVAVVGNRPRDDRDTVTLPDGKKVAPIIRTRTAASRDDDVADIRTLTGPRDEGIDLSIAPDSSVNRTVLKQTRAEQQPSGGWSCCIRSTRVRRRSRASMRVMTSAGGAVTERPSPHRVASSGAPRWCFPSRAGATTYWSSTTTWLPICRRCSPLPRTRSRRTCPFWSWTRTVPMERRPRDDRGRPPGPATA